MLTSFKETIGDEVIQAATQLHRLSVLTVPSPTIPSPTIPSRTIPSQTIPSPAIPSPAIPSPTIPSPTRKKRSYSEIEYVTYYNSSPNRFGLVSECVY